MVVVSKLIVLEVGEGDFERGFAVVLRIGETGKPHRVEFRGHFPPAPEILELFDRWQSAYYRWGDNHSWGRILEPDFPSPTTDVSDWDNCSHAAEQLKAGLHNWFDRPQMRDLRERILEKVGREQPARLILQTQHPILRKLPWHLWQLLERRPQLEIAISTQYPYTFQRLLNPLKIFGILGSTEGIDIEGDRAMLESLPNATVKLLVEPSDRVIKALKDSRLFEEFGHIPWDILFFAGYSHNEGDSETGFMWRIDTDRLIPLIVMREPLPTPVAQAFLKYFLKTFSEGESFYLSMRKAREQLHSFEKNYPCASWLPVICQNPAAPELKYPQRKWKKPAKLGALNPIVWGAIGGSALSIALSIAKEVWFIQQPKQQVQKVQEVQFKSQELEALLEAMEAGQELKKLVQDGRRLEKYPTVSPILTLKTILDNIHEQNQLTENQGSFKSASFSPDGKRVFTISSDGTAKVWDISGKLLAELKGDRKAELEGDKKSVNSASFSSDGTRIVTTFKDNTAQVWDISGQLLAELKAGDRASVEESIRSIESATFSPDGRHILTTSWNGIAQVWDISGQLLAELKGHKKLVESVSFSPDSRRVVTASRDGTAKLWDISGQLIAELKANNNQYEYGFSPSVSFSPDGQHIVATFASEFVKVWNISSKLIKEYPVVATGASFSSDGKNIATFSISDDTVRIWYIGSPTTVLPSPTVSLIGHRGGVESASFSSNGQFIVVVPYQSEGTAKVWEIYSNASVLSKVNDKPLISLNRRGIASASFSPNENRLVTISSSGFQSKSNNIVNIWDLSDRRFGYIKSFQGNELLPYSEYAGSPDGQHILTSDGALSLPGSPISVWDLSGKRLVKLKGGLSLFPPIFSPDGLHILTSEPWTDEPIKIWNLSGELIAKFNGWRAVFSPDGKRIILISNDLKTAQVWGLPGKLLTEIKEYPIMSASFSSDGQHIITGNFITASLWDLSSNRRLLLVSNQKLIELLVNKQIALDKKKLTALPPPSFSPDGQRILTVTYDNTVRLLNLSGKLLTEKAYKARIREARFSPDGQHILIRFDMGKAHVWNLSSRRFTELKRHQDKIFQASFSPDGQRILTTSDDNFVRLWDLSGRLSAELKVPNNDFPDEYFKGAMGLKSAFFSQDGKQIVTVSSDRIIRTWRVEGLDELLARGCDWLKDYLATHPEARERLKVCQQKGTQFKAVQGR